MTTTFQTTATFDKDTYAKGEVMQITLAGDAQNTQPTTTTAEQSVTITLTAADGTVTTVNAGPVTVVTTGTTVTTLAVTITGVTDDNGRAWVIAADGRSATATA